MGTVDSFRFCTLFTDYPLYFHNNLINGVFVVSAGEYIIMRNILSALDVAAYILEKHGSTTIMKLQKLVYYCQAWSLVWDEEPLFHEDIEAWANSPVVPDLFYAHQEQFKVLSISNGKPDKLDETQQETVDAVIDFYGNESSQYLSDLVHMEEPWKKARAGLSEMVRGKRVIKLADMEEYYSSLPKD